MIDIKSQHPLSGAPLKCKPSMEVCSVCVFCWEEPGIPLYCRLDRDKLPTPYYQDGNITIYNSDCKEILPLLTNIDLILTDPPYQFESKGGGFYGNWHGNGNENRENLNDLEKLNCCNFVPQEFLPIMPSKYGYYFCNKELIAQYIQYARNNNLLFDVHVVHKTNPIPAKQNHYLHDLEYIIMMRPKGSFFNHKSEFRNYSKMYSVSNSGKKRLHPAEKPIGLMQKYLKVSLPIGGVVLDPFMGSGTTLCAAKTLNMLAIGIEQEEKYCAIATDRLRRLKCQLQIF